MLTLDEAIRHAAPEGRLSCARAFLLAGDLGVEPLALGQAATSLAVSITHCQLGLFGYSDTGKGRVVTAAPDAAAEVGGSITSRLAQGRLPCREAWEIAKETGRSRLDIANAAEALAIRISLCQLGCFP